MKYRVEIDGLRALAVMPVIFFHAGFEWFSGGFVGVDVFFVISGYLITTIIISEMAEGKFSIVNFYERRARRILPALFFVMAACLPFAWLWFTPSELKDFGESLVAVSIFSANILFWLESGYFDTASELKPLLHTWSLAVEEQYYILFPIFLIFAWKLGVKWILILLSIVFFISLAAAQWGAYNMSSANFYLLPTRGWELLVGVFIAFYLKHNTHFNSHSINQLLSLAGFGMIVYSIIAFDKTTPFPSLYTLIPTIGTGLLILCAVPKTFIHKLLSLKFFVWIGLFSYSAYLWHQPLLAFTRHRFMGEVSDLILIFLCIFSLLIAWFSWRFVEFPFRQKNKIDRKKFVFFSVSSLIIFIVFGLSIHQKNGFSGRFDSHQLSYLNMTAEGRKDRNYDCHLERSEYAVTGCIFGDQSIPPNFALVGDSHAGAIHDQMGQAFRKSEKSFILYAKDACPPSIGLEDKSKSFQNCSLFNLGAIEDIVKNGISSVVLFSRFTWYVEQERLQSPIGVKLKNIRAFISELRKRDIRVLVIEPIPEMELDAPKRKFFSLVYKVPMPTINRIFYEESIKKSFDILIEPFIDDIGFEIVNTSDIFCNEYDCFVERNGDLLFYDNNHPSISASKKIVEKILKAL